MAQPKEVEEAGIEMDYDAQARDLAATIAACHEAEEATKNNLVQSEVERIDALEDKSATVKKRRSHGRRAPRL